MLVAELSWSGGAARVARVGEFAYPAGVTLEQGQTLGIALGEFLKREGYTCRRAVLGVPARWLLLKAQGLPPADAATAAAMLSLRAEAESAPELGEMSFDYSGQCSTLSAGTVLLMGLPKRWIERLRTVAEAAGLQIAAITPSAAALGSATAVRAGNPYVVSVRPEGAELAVQQGEQTRYMRHLGSATSGTGLVTELRRAATLHPMNGDATTAAEAAAGVSRHVMMMWDDVGLDAGVVDAVSGAVGMPVVRGEVQSLGVAGATNGRAGLGASAIALALAAAGGAGGGSLAGQIDFLRPRVVPPKKQSVNLRTRWIAAGAAVVALVAVVAYTDLARLEGKVTAAEKSLQTLDPAVKMARPFVANMQFVEGFARAASPRALSCMRDLTGAIPAESQTYLTSFHLQSNLRGEFTGRAMGNLEVLNLIDRLNASGRFADLKRKLDARGTGPEVSFSVTFTYIPAPATAGGAAAMEPRASR